MNEKEIETTLTTSLFRGVTKDALLDLTERCNAYLIGFSSGDEISFFQNDLGRIGILLSGSLTVFADEKKRVLLNRLSPGDTFGVSVLYGERGAGTVTVGHGKGKILFFNADSLEPLWENRVIRTNLISFLADRIRFLNKKISSLSQSGAEGKLLRFLSQSAKEDGMVLLPGSLSALAGSLNLGRASLYRALSKLEEDGVIERDGKNIRLLAPESLVI